MQTIYKDEVERRTSGEIGTMDPVICARRNSRYVERKCDRGIGSRGVRI